MKLPVGLVPVPVLKFLLSSNNMYDMVPVVNLHNMTGIIFET
jgi:hypothetical protein